MSGGAAAAQGEAAQDQTSTPTPPAHSGDFWGRDALTGDWDGWRNKLEDAGVILGADSIDEVLGNPVGGVKSGAIYEGRLELLTTIDLDKTLGLSNATFHANAYQIRGRGLSADNLDNNLLTVSNIEAARSLRLFDLWIEQILFDGKLSLRFGQIAADDEFFISQYSASLINSTFGWPAIMGFDLPSGGPAYPLATPGARIKVVSGEFSFAAALFDGNPAGPQPGDPQVNDGSGTAFRTSDPAFTIAEVAYATNQEKDAAGLPASYKLGGWYHAGQFPDQRFDTTGQSLASPTSSGIPAARHGNYGLYAVIDQGVWHDQEVKSRSAAVFLRLASAPSDRNLVSFYADTGAILQGPIPSRGDDLIALGVALAKISGEASALDRDTRQFTGIATPVRDDETATELSYLAQVTQWWTLQPDLQFIVHPGANVPQPGNPTHAVSNAFVIGLRSAVVF
jgi:porin